MLKDFLLPGCIFTNYDLAEGLPGLLDESLALGVIDSLANLGLVTFNVYYGYFDKDGYHFLGNSPYYNGKGDVDVIPMAVVTVLQ